MRRELSILFVGDLTPFTRSDQRLRALAELGHEVTGISTAPTDDVPGTRRRSLFERILHRAGATPDVAGTNRSVVEHLRTGRYDVLWVEKALCLRPETLRRARALHPNMRLAFFSEDAMARPHNQSRHFRAALPLYDVVFTTKSRNVELEDLQELGAREVHYVPKTFDPGLHRPVEIDGPTIDQVGSHVSFVGTCAQERAEALSFLAENGIAVRVWGNGWEAWRDRHPLLHVEGRPVWGEEYVRCLCASDVNLGFLRRENHDRHTDRSVEIPACGAFLLAERTDEHRAMFVEGEEADFFEEHGELLQKVRYWLEHAEERRGVAAAGRARVVADDRTHASALRSMLAIVRGEAEEHAVDGPPPALPAGRTPAPEAALLERVRQR